MVGMDGMLYSKLIRGAESTLEAPSLRQVSRTKYLVVGLGVCRAAELCYACRLKRPTAASANPLRRSSAPCFPASRGT